MSDIGDATDLSSLSNLGYSGAGDLSSLGFGGVGDGSDIWLGSATSDAAPGSPGAVTGSNPQLNTEDILPGPGQAGGPMSGTTGGKPVTERLGEALQKLASAGKQSQEESKAPVQARLNTAQLPQSAGASRGQSSLSSLVQMLLQRASTYGPPGAGSSSTRGLLG